MIPIAMIAASSEGIVSPVPRIALPARITAPAISVASAARTTVNAQLGAARDSRSSVHRIAAYQTIVHRIAVRSRPTVMARRQLVRGEPDERQDDVALPEPEDAVACAAAPPWTPSAPAGSRAPCSRYGSSGWQIGHADRHASPSASSSATNAAAATGSRRAKLPVSSSSVSMRGP